MKLRVRKVGDALGMILPTEVLQALHLHEGDLLALTRNDGGFQLSVASGEFETQMALARKLLVRYGATLRELAR